MKWHSIPILMTFICLLALGAAAETVHTVQRGETLSRVANTYGVTADELARHNGITDPNRIFVGQRLVIPMAYTEHRVMAGETLSGLAQRYGLTVTEILQANKLQDPNRIRVGQILIIPGFDLRIRGDLRMSWPLQGRITSPYGPRWGRLHQGIDIASPIGAPIYAAAPGRVSYSGWATGYGRLIILDHGQGVQTYYAHASANLVSTGETVARGQMIAKVGVSGDVTGPHLHFEIRLDGEPIDPVPWLPR